MEQKTEAEVNKSAPETPKKSDEYMIYDYKNGGNEKGLHLFSVCKQGRGHINDGKPCQDFCAAEVESSYAILVDSDGVSACEKSDVGARLACEATIETVRETEKEHPTEEKFVEALQSVEFRNRILNCWMKKVFSDCEIEKKEGVNRYPELRKYGATLMFAVITSHWYVAGNLGDGQVMLFNSDFGIKVRNHSLKTSSTVDCLVNVNCASESFQVACYPRKYFHGVLMSTDGVYDRLQSSKSFHCYGEQLRKRFLSGDVPEPRQPFIYEVKENLQKNLWNLTADDCSIVLAVDESEKEPVISPVIVEELNKFQAWESVRLAENCATFLVQKEEKLYELVATAVPLIDCVSLNGIRIYPVEEHWTVEGISFALYKRYKMESMEAMYNAGKFRQHNSYPEESAKEVLYYYDCCCTLKKELADQGYGLNDAAAFLVQFAGAPLQEQIVVKQEALCTLKEEKEKDDFLQRFFLNVLGTLQFDEERYPIFGTGYAVSGMVLRSKKYGKDLCRVVRTEKKYYLKNLSGSSWKLSDGRIIPAEESVLLDGKFVFEIEITEEQKIGCSYVPQEEA